MTFNERLCQLIDARLARDPFFEPNEVAVNISLEGEVVYCWARQPGRFKLRRFQHLVRQAHRDLLAQERTAAPQARRENDLDSMELHEAGAK